MANIITVLRIPCSIAMAAVPAFSFWFYVLYLLCGFSDMIDGTIARMTNSASEFGGKLDTAADLVFAAIAMLKLLPMICLPGWLWVWIAAIAVICIVNAVSCRLYRRKWMVLHTLANKATGLMLFLLPMTLQVFDIRYSAAIVCVAATFAAVQEGHIIRSGGKSQ